MSFIVLLVTFQNFKELSLFYSKWLPSLPIMIPQSNSVISPKDLWPSQSNLT
jgi:hypothetical protein